MKKRCIIYDFDGTLTPYPLPKFKVLENCGLPNGTVNKQFLEMAKQKAKEDNLENWEAIYEVYFEIIRNKNMKLIDSNLCLGTDEIIYNKGVNEFLKYFKEHNTDNYLISSGPKVYLDKTSISNHFKKIYATTFYYDEKKEVTNINCLMSDQKKVDAIKDIIKDNDYCKNIIYIGDGFSDYYAMEYIKKHGGTSILVYHNQNDPNIKELENKGVISFATKADYSFNGELFHYIKQIIKKEIK